MPQVILFHALLRGEDGLEFCVECQCLTAEDMEGWVEECYPDASILDIYSEQTLNQREAERYNRLADEMDSGVYYD
jgi:succinate dehydrogenase/fumarate reductase-like Fe-S protein